MARLNAYFRCPYCKALNVRKVTTGTGSPIDAKLMSGDVCEDCQKKINLRKVRIKYTVQNLRG